MEIHDLTFTASMLSDEDTGGAVFKTVNTMDAFLLFAGMGLFMVGCGIFIYLHNKSK